MGIFMSIFTKFIRQPRRKPVPASLISEPLGFLNLPPEIRSNIYDLLLVAPNGIMNCSHKDFKPHQEYKWHPKIEHRQLSRALVVGSIL